MSEHLVTCTPIMDRLWLGRNRPLSIGYLLQDSTPDFDGNEGAKRHIFAVIEKLRARGHRVRIVGVRNRKIFWTDDFHNWNPPELGWSKSRPFRFGESILRRIQKELNLPFLNLFDSFRFSDACCKALDGYDVIYSRHAFNGWGDVMTAWRLGLPLVVEVNGDIFWEVSLQGLSLSKIQRWIIWNIIQLTYCAASKIVFVTKGLQARVKRQWRIDPRKAVVIRNGTDIELMTTNYDRQQVLEQYGLKDGPIIGFVGSFQPWYAVDRLVESFKLVRMSVPDTQLVLVGDGKMRSKIAEQIQRLGLSNSIIMTGQVDYSEVSRILSIVDIGVIPHLQPAYIEATLKLLDYMAAGKAIIISGVQADSCASHNEFPGILIENTDAQSLAEAIVNLCVDKDSRMKLGQNAQREAREKYSWENTVNRIEEVCYSLLTKKTHV